MTNTKNELCEYCLAHFQKNEFVSSNAKNEMNNILNIVINYTNYTTFYEQKNYAFSIHLILSFLFLEFGNILLIQGLHKCM